MTVLSQSLLPKISSQSSQNEYLAEKRFVGKYMGIGKTTRPSAQKTAVGGLCGEQDGSNSQQEAYRICQQMI